MFFNNKNTAKIEALEKDIIALRKEFRDLALDVEIWYSKLKMIKGVKKIERDTEDLPEEKDIYGSVLLGDNGQPTKPFRRG